MQSVYKNNHQDIVLAESSHIFRIISYGLKKLDELSRVQLSMERELNSFLNNYYARILPLCEMIDRMKNRKYSTFFIEKPSESKTQEFIKKLYRKLAKAYHPDNVNAKNTDNIHRVINAYQTKSIAKLWQIEIERVCSEINDGESLNKYLEWQKARISNLILQTEARNQEIAISAEWQLKERVFEAHLQGIDLVFAIETQLRKKINSATALSAGSVAHAASHAA